MKTLDFKKNKGIILGIFPYDDDGHHWLQKVFNQNQIIYLFTEMDPELINNWKKKCEEKLGTKIHNRNLSVKLQLVPELISLAREASGKLRPEVVTLLSAICIYEINVIGIDKQNGYYEITTNPTENTVADDKTIQKNIRNRIAKNDTYIVLCNPSHCDRLTRLLGIPHSIIIGTKYLKENIVKVKEQSLRGEWQKEILLFNYVTNNFYLLSTKKGIFSTTASDREIKLLVLLLNKLSITTPVTPLKESKDIEEEKPTTQVLTKSSISPLSGTLMLKYLIWDLPLPKALDPNEEDDCFETSKFAH